MTGQPEERLREYDPARDQNTSSGLVSLRAGDADRTVAIAAVPRSPALAVGVAAWANGFFRYD